MNHVVDDTRRALDAEQDRALRAAMRETRFPSAPDPEVDILAARFARVTGAAIRDGRGVEVAQLRRKLALRGIRCPAPDPVEVAPARKGWGYWPLVGVAVVLFGMVAVVEIQEALEPSFEERMAETDRAIEKLRRATALSRAVERALGQ